MNEIIQSSLSLLWPELTLTVTFILTLFSQFALRKAPMHSGYVALAGFLLAFLLLGTQGGSDASVFGVMLAVDPFAVFFKYLIIISGILVLGFSLQSEEIRNNAEHAGEYFAFLTSMTLGMFLMAGASNLLMMYLSIELVSLSSYVLSGYLRNVERSNEAALKYVIFGAVSSGLMLYGISLIYGLTGALDIYSMRDVLATGAVMPGSWAFATLVAAVILIIGGFGYKISAVPFHYWTPDVYEGAPITITAYLSVASKAAGFAIMIRFFKVAFLNTVSADGAWEVLAGMNWELIIAVISVLTMTLGNLVALWQDNLKRMLAYSSIAHAGYMLMGLVVATDNGIAAIMVYFVMYLIMNLGAFYVVMVVAQKTGSEDIDDYRGLAYRAPWVAGAMAIFLVSLTGLPPTAGFIGKLWIFAAVLSKPGFVWLAIIGVINSVISLYYYARVFRNMYLRQGDEEKAQPILFGSRTIAGSLIFAVPTIVFGLYFGPILEWAKNSVTLFLR